MPAPTAPSSVTRVALTGDSTLDPLLQGTRWASNTVTYSFAEFGSIFAFSDYGQQSSGREPWSREFAPLSSSDRPFFQLALQKWSSVANINFVQVTESSSNVGDIRAAYTYQFAHNESVAWAYLPFQSASAGDVWFNARGVSGSDVWRPGSFAYFTVLHELGHALGLTHPFESTAFSPQLDTQALTLMSYSALPGLSTTSSFSFYPTTPMLLDIRALQHLYGWRANNAGDTVYAYGDTGYYHETIWDTGGSDTLRYDGVREAVLDLTLASRVGNPVEIYSLSAPSRVAYNVWIADGVEIENAIGGSAADTITGTSKNNVLTGRGGNDIIDGGAGIDTAVFTGSIGLNTIRRNGDTVMVSGADGTDTLTNVERLLIGTTKIAIDINGNGGQAYRLYQAAFNRTPDQAGLGYQMNALDTGFTLSQVAGNFIASPEFSRTYGSLDNTQFVTQLYANVLHRAPDAPGLAFHVSNLSRGMARADVLVGFSESPENQAALIGVISSGMTYL